ncbi:MAG: response regulator transcription factor [Gammaproteobacteria bacterium]
MSNLPEQRDRPASPSPQYLIIDDNEVFASTLARAVRRLGYPVEIAHHADTALQRNREQQPHRLVLDLKLGQSSGLTLIAPLKADNPDCSIVVLTGYSSISTAVEAIKLGAHQYLCKPAGAAEIINAFGEQADPASLELPDQPPSVDRLQWEHIQRVLQQHDGNISATARALGMHRRTLQRKLVKKPARQ